MSGGRSGTVNTDELVVVGKYTQTRQRWLRTKIVKSDHGRHYKKGDPRIETKKKQALRKERKKKDKRKIES